MSSPDFAPTLVIMGTAPDSLNRAAIGRGLRALGIQAMVAYGILDGPVISAFTFDAPLRFFVLGTVPVNPTRRCP